MKGVIIYKGKYAATRQYADWLGTELQLPVIIADNIEGKKIAKYDFVVLGSSVYIGKLQIHNWLKNNMHFVCSSLKYCVAKVDNKFNKAKIYQLNLSNLKNTRN